MKRVRMVKGQPKVMDARRKLVQCSFCPRREWRWCARAVVRCKRCVNASARANYLARKPTAKVDPGEYWRTHPAARLAYMAAYREKHRKKLRRYARNYWRSQAKKNRAVVRSLPCLDCGLSHSPEHRLAILRRMEGFTPSEIRDAYPCLWGAPTEHTTGRARMFFRDLAALKSSSEKQPTRAA